MDHPDEPPQPARALLALPGILRAKLWSILGGGVLGVVVAGLGFVLLPARFEATASLVMAHVLGAPVEVPAVLVEKIKSGTYFSEATWAACGVSDAEDPGRRLADKIHPVSNRNAPFVGLSFTSLSTGSAAACLAQVIGELTAAQDKLIQPVVVAKRAQLEEMKQRLALLQASNLAIQKMQGVAEVRNEQFAVQSLWLSAAISRHDAERDLARRIADLEIKLTAPLTHPTRLASAIYAPPIPLRPPAWLVLLAGFMVGGFLSIGLIWLRWVSKEGAAGKAVT